MKSAVITGCKRKKIFKKPSITEYETHVILELPFTLDEFETVTDRKLQRTLEKGIAKLKEAGINRAVLTNTLKQVLSPNIRMADFRVIDGSNLRYEFLPKMFDHLCGEFQLDSLDKKIGISERSLTRKSQNLIETLCYQAKFMTLATADMVVAKRYADQLLQNFGVMLDVRHIDQVDGENLGDIVIDIDQIAVTVPSERTVSKVEIPDLEIPSNIDLFDVLACLGLNVNNVNAKFY